MYNVCEKKQIAYIKWMKKDDGKMWVPHMCFR